MMGREDSQDLLQTRWAFGPFILSAVERQLFRDNVPVRIGSRSLDILIALCRNAGEVVEKHELIRRVWGGLVVDEGALRVHINGLRRALNEDQADARYVVNVPGRGYSLATSLSVVPDPVPHPAAARNDRFSHLPMASSRTIGRETDVLTLVAQLQRHRFVSVVGPGGIGKTTVVVEALRRLGEDFDRQIRFVNLSAVTDLQAVHSTIASLLGVGAGIGGGDILSDLLAFLDRSRSILVLDSCEHVIEPVVMLAEAIRRSAPLASLLTTTREPLRIDGEQILRLPSLECPPEGVALTAADCLRFPAVELFVERVMANVADFRLTDEDAPVVAAICRRLDGVALALELGAGRVEAYGLSGTAELLQRRLGLLWQGRRTAPPRHQTLQATLDWSYDLLEPAERIVLARLAVFAGAFTLRAAVVVASDVDVNGVLVIDMVAGLVAKSLVSPVAGSSPLKYRLLDTTRTYALAKLARLDDCAAVALRHAELMISHLHEAAEQGLAPIERFTECLSDVRSALEWCFHDGGDLSVGVRLVAIAATPLLEHALCDECYRRTELALAHLTPAQRGTAIELELQTSRGWSAMFSAGKGEAVHGAFARGLELAESDPDPHQQLRLLNGLSFVLSRQCDHLGGLEFAQRAAAVARQTSDASVIALADWALGVSHHLCGHQDLVLRYCESALSPPMTTPYARRIADYGYDYRGRALIARARALWLLGYPEQAAAAARSAIAAVDELRHPISVFVVLVYAATVFLWCKDWAAASGAIERLRSHSQTQTLVYREIGAALGAMLNCRMGASDADLAALSRSLGRLVQERHLILVPIIRTTLADALLASGRIEEARAVIDAAVRDLGPQVDGPEILRVKGAVMAALGFAEEGEVFLQRSIGMAREQAALAWELRATLTLVQISGPEARSRALAELAAAYSRFDEGHDTDDLRAARALLGQSGSTSGLSERK